MKNKNEPMLCLGTGMHFDIPVIEQLKPIKEAGFDAVFTDWEKDLSIGELVREAEKLGLYYQSLHAPFYGMDDLWHDDEGELAKKMTVDLLATIDDCHKYKIPYVIMHTIIGMDNHSPNELGLERIEKVIDYAEDKGVTVLFENTEGEEYLEAVLNRFGERKNVGFCFDSGHEMCYNYSHDLVGKFGKYLLSTHLNDNLGMTDINNMTFLDDSHLLPFDGVADWDNIAKRLHKCNYDGILTFELISKSKKGRHANDIYSNMSFEEYLAEAYNRAERFKKIYTEE